MARAAAPRQRTRQRRGADGGERATVAVRAAVRGAADGAAPRGGPRAALAPAVQPAGDPVVRRAEPEPTLPPLAIGRFEDLIALAAQKRDLGVKLALERDVRLVRCEDGRLEIALGAERGEDAGQRSRRANSRNGPTGAGWWWSRRTPGQPTVKSQDDARQAELKTGVRADPLVQAVLARFPGAEIVDVRKVEAVPQALPPGRSRRADAGTSAADDDGSAFGAHGLPDGDPGDDRS